MIAKQVELLAAISEAPHLPSDLRRRWHDRLDGLSVTQADAEGVLRDLRNEIDAAEQDLPECELALIYTGLGDLSSMCAEHRRRAHQ